MDLEQHIQNLKDYIRIDKDNIAYDDSDFAQFCKGHCEDIQAVLNELDNRIPKEILEEYLRQAEERYKTYKEASKENEGCKGGMWRYLGQVNILKRILGKSIKIVTLDKE